jgi:RIO kinase 1
LEKSWKADLRVVRKALQKAFINEKKGRYLEKRSEDYDVLEEVFDRPTLFALYELMNSGVFRYLNGIVSAGKESRVYLGVKDDNTSLAVKIYLVTCLEFKKHLSYIIGDPRFLNIKKGTRNIVELWTKKEFKNLQQALKSGIRVPIPYAINKNILVMEFIGINGKPSPLLIECDVNQSNYNKLILNIENLFKKARLVHADLSEYNIFKYKQNLILFDFGSAIDVSHPEAINFLKRDLFNINRFFYKRGINIKPIEQLLQRIIS